MQLLTRLILAVVLVVCLQAQERPILAGGWIQDGFAAWGRVPVAQGVAGVDAAMQWRDRETERIPNQWVRTEETENYEAGGSLRVLEAGRLAVYASGGVAREINVRLFQFLQPSSGVFQDAKRRTGAYGAVAAVFRIAGPLHGQVRYTRRFAADFSEVHGLQFGIAWRF